jgi:external thioesterase TEII
MKNNKKQLFILPFAGGNCYSLFFLNILESSFELHFLELPGRGKRMKEKLLISKIAAIDDYVQQIKLLRNNCPFLVYGHSLGAELGFYAVRALEEMNINPAFLILSGNAGPQRRYTKTYLLDEISLKNELKRLGGIKDEVLNNKDLFNFFSPIIRADFEILEKESISYSNLKIKTPIHAIMGTNEERVEKINNWEKFTLGTFKYEILSGNHFFIYDHPYKLAQIILNSCA